MGIGTILGLAGAATSMVTSGLNMALSGIRTRQARKALEKMGPRPKLTVPKEIRSMYEDRLKASKMYQGFTQAELNKMRSDQGRYNATLFGRMAGIGASPQAIQAMAANNAMTNWTDIAAKSAVMDRERRSSARRDAMGLAGQIGQYVNMSERSDQMNYDRIQSELGRSIAMNQQAMSDSLTGLGKIGATMAVSPEIWGLKG
jgi:hypothetical protein